MQQPDPPFLMFGCVERKDCRDWLFLFCIQNMRLYKRKCLDVSAILFLMKTFLTLKKRGHCTSLRAQIIAYTENGKTLRMELEH